MRLNDSFHLSYSTNIHRGETWQQTFNALNNYTVAVRAQVCPDAPYGIGLWLSDMASRELSDPKVLLDFQRWLDAQNCYVFTLNGFPYGRFHGGRVKEQVYVPDWTTPERVQYTKRLFDLLAQLVPEGSEGSVSTVPCSFKEFIRTPDQVRAMRDHLWQCVDHIAAVSEKSGRILHLGLEPEPLCYLETSVETAEFFDALRDDRPNDPRLARHLGVNYDACHLAVEFEEPAEAIGRLLRHEIKISKLHFSSALRVQPTPDTRKAMTAFCDDVYFHQVVERGPEGQLRRFVDLDHALAEADLHPPAADAEWRIHFHIPLHCQPTSLFGSTSDHILGVMDLLQTNPTLCSHLEMETYTWEVLPPELKNRNVVDQLVSEYRWCLSQLEQRGILHRTQ